MADILVVSWEKGLAQAMVQALGTQGHRTVVAEDGQEAFRAVWNLKFSLVILDFVIPNMAGTELIRWLRADPALDSMPILLLASYGWAPDPSQKLAAPDDVLLKPLEIAALIEKVEALLTKEVNLVRSFQPSEFQVGPLRVDSRTFSVSVGAEGVPLTPTEFKLLRYFMEHVEEVIPVTTLVRDLWGTEGQIGGPELVRVHIRNLRAKIQQAAGHPIQAISNVPRKGYVMLREF